MHGADLAKRYEREEPTKKYIDMPTETVREPNRTVAILAQGYASAS